MPRIRVTPEQLHRAASDFHRAVADVEALRNRIRSSWSTLSSYEFSQRAKLDSQIERVDRQALELGRFYEERAAFLERAAEAFANADNAGVSQLAGLPASAYLVQTSLSLPVAGGGWLADFGLENVPIPALFAAVLPAALLANLPEWLRKLLEKWFPWLAPPHEEAPPPVPPAKPTTTFGDLLNRPMGSEHEYSIYHRVPLEYQEDRFGYAACVPTSVSMVMQYFHNQDPDNIAMSPQELEAFLDKEDKIYLDTKGGISPDRLTNEVKIKEYNVTASKRNATMDELQSHLETGPVIVLTGSNLEGWVPDQSLRDNPGPGSYSHAVVVTGISADNKWISINDPWTGREREYSMEDFNKMWAGGQNSIYVIRP